MSDSPIPPAATIRYFCQMLPSGGKSLLAYDYLTSIEKTGVGVKMMSIGPAFFHVEPWNQITHLYMAPLADCFINAVCVPTDFSLGVRVKAGEAAPNVPPTLQPVPDQSQAVFPNIEKSAEDAEKVVYEPQTAFAALFTVGVPNIAFTRVFPQRPPSDSEIQVLQKYDAVVTPFKDDIKVFALLGISAVVVHPESEDLAPLLSRFSPS